MTIIQEDYPAMTQGTIEWLALRKTKITATDAAVILNLSPWKTPLQLYKEKLSFDSPEPPNAAMQRGLYLEPFARNFFIHQTGIDVIPKVVIKEWAMASLDGYNEEKEIVVEIKCPGERDHEAARSGNIPQYYYAQMQHQMYVSGFDKAFYISYREDDAFIVSIARDDKFIEKMIALEYEFWERLIFQVPPDPVEKDYIEKDSSLWEFMALRYKTLVQEISEKEKELENIKKHIVEESGERNAQGHGIKLTQITRKGNVDYSKIECLKQVDLEQYRKPKTTSWRITLI